VLVGSGIHQAQALLLLLLLLRPLLLAVLV
jgi:hypothetical protein